MNKHKTIITVVLLMSLSISLLMPATPVAAASVLDLLSSSSSGKANNSGGDLINILMGLLLGKLFGNLSGSLANNPVFVPTDTGVNYKTAAATITPLSEGQALIATAKKYMGTSYVWGGETPDGFDCSGFTQYVMNKNGITLPRTAEQQYATGQPVDKSNLQIGDLVFFTTYKPGASHVGFYMGDGNFIHASSAAKEVTINSLTEQFYSDHYIGARRYSN